MNRKLSLLMVGFVAFATTGCSKSTAAEAKATVGLPGVPAGKPRVLVVMSSANFLPLKDGREYRTGYFLNELMIPVKTMIDAGIEPVFASPAGTPAVMDPHSDDVTFFGGDERTYAQIKKLRDELLEKPSRRLPDVVREGLDTYAGVFFPGGHAPMADLIENADVGRILVFFHEHGKPTGLICHGPVALLATTHDPHGFVAALAASDWSRAQTLAAPWPYAGYKMTVFSTAEEKQVEEPGFLHGFVRFYPDDAVRAAGGDVETALPFQSHVVRDRELFTGQQPSSDAEFAKLFVPAVLASARASISSR